eukprot:NODE_154_length_15322_cov_0.584510.p3 type:complete len:472 gc:universal NODE_154_length_15322_cov_0.584510:9946-8531(-)
MIPLAFVFQDFTLFFRVFTLILMGLIIGLTIIGQFLLAPLEIIFAYLITKLYDRLITDILLKNLSAHRSKNRYTSLVFTLCLSYIIFVSVMFNIQADSLNKLTENVYGSDIRLYSLSYEKPLQRDILEEFLSNKTTSTPGFSHVVQGYSFATFDLLDYYPVADGTLSSLSGFLPLSSSIFGIEEQFSSSVFKDYIMVTQPINILKEINIFNELYDFTDRNYKPDDSLISVSKVYGRTNQIQRYTIPFIGSQQSLDNMYFPMNSKGELILYILPVNEINTVSTRFIMKPVGLVSKMPGYTEISSFSSSTAMFVQMGDFKKLLETVDSFAKTNISLYSSQSIPIKDCFIKIESGASDLQVESFMNELNTIINQNTQIQDARKAKKDTDDSKAKGEYALSAVSIGAMILCFFVLIISFESNVKDNSWEYGVLRSLGFTKATLLRLYIYEALCIVLSSAALGTTIGCLTGVFFCL